MAKKMDIKFVGGVVITVTGEQLLKMMKKIPFGGTKGASKEFLKSERTILRAAHKMVGGEDYWRIGDSLATLDYRIRHTTSKLNLKNCGTYKPW